MSLVYILLGTNLGDKQENLKTATAEINKTGKLVKSSSVYETSPWGFEHPESFLNQVILIDTRFSPGQLLSSLLEIEEKTGRKRTSVRYEARIIDLDILFYDDRAVQSPVLTIPHPMLHLRRFTLEPLCEIAPSLIHPVFKKTIEALLQECPDKGLVKRIELEPPEEEW